MSFGSGNIHITKQNRNLKPSRRSKFKENNRDAIYANTDVALEKPVFKKISKMELNIVMARIRASAKKQKQREKIIVIVSALFVLGLCYGLYFYTKGFV